MDNKVNGIKEGVGVKMPKAEAKKLGTQNSASHKPAGENQSGNKVVKEDNRDSKKLNMYSDAALNAAKRARGM